jgi:hypothetical protein
VRCATAHCIAHNVAILSAEEAEQSCSLHFVVCGRRERGIWWCGRVLKRAQVKWGRVK